MVTNRDFKKSAVNYLNYQWFTSAVIVFVASIIVATPLIFSYYGLAFSLVLSWPIIFGIKYAFLMTARGEYIEIKMLFVGFTKKYFKKVMRLYLLKLLYTLLWAILLIIPAIFKGISYFMSDYVLIDNPELKVSKCITKSRQIMDGNKLNFIGLYLTFIGWSLLPFITFGISFFYVLGYQFTAYANFYDANKTNTGTSYFEKLEQDIFKYYSLYPKSSI